MKLSDKIINDALDKIRINTQGNIDIKDLESALDEYREVLCCEKTQEIRDEQLKKLGIL
jgi:hypothetical protein